MSILLHMSSTDKAPKHTHCPDGASSWCFWQRAMAKSEAPGSHNEHETMPPEIGQETPETMCKKQDTESK